MDVDLVDHLQQQLESVKEERTSYQKMAEANEEELREMQKVYRDVSVLNKHFKEDLASTKVFVSAVWVVVGERLRIAMHNTTKYVSRYYLGLYQDII